MSVSSTVEPEMAMVVTGLSLPSDVTVKSEVAGVAVESVSLKVRTTLLATMEVAAGRSVGPVVS